MKKLLWGMAIGAVAGAVAYKKMHDANTVEKALDAVQEKLK